MYTRATPVPARRRLMELLSMHGSMARALGFTIALLLVAVGTVRAEARDSDPVVLEGWELERVLGLPVGEIVAFRYDAAWVQIPVQIDERKYVDFGVVRNQTPFGYGTIGYCDPDTYVGPDTDPDFDVDDELVFMAGDCGERAPVRASPPEGVLPDSATELVITDPLGGRERYLYLFHSDGSLDPAAGADYVSYDFDLLAGPYIPNYRTSQGPNPENTFAITDHYQEHFSDRWIRDETRVFAGGATGDDVLDRHKSMFALGICNRTENTFSLGGGGFFANLDGPVRGVRSYLGANSGTFTQRDHYFYAARFDVVTFLRVHAIAGLADVYDYTPEAIGMRYHNDLNLAGVTIDGMADVVEPGAIRWEMVTGPQGTLYVVHLVETDIEPYVYTSVYEDNLIPRHVQCTGDGFELGTSGPFRGTAIPNTDPRQSPTYRLTWRRINYTEAPGGSVEQAAVRDDRARTPLQVAATPYPRALGDHDGDCRIDLDDAAEFWTCRTGPGVCAPNACDVFDFDGDCDVDLHDAIAFLAAYTGPDDPIPGCDE
jgi:hypothetical protein